VNPSSTVAGFGFAFPPAADDQDLPVTITTDYTLEPGKDYVKVETHVLNLGASPLDIYFADYLNGSGQVDLWQPTVGWGEPLITTRDGAAAYQPCTANGTCDPQNMVAYVGIDGGQGTSYGYITPVNGTTTFSTSGVTIPLLGQDAVFTLIGASAPNFHMAANGSPGDEIVVTRYFAVGGDRAGWRPRRRRAAGHPQPDPRRHGQRHAARHRHLRRRRCGRRRRRRVTGATVAGRSARRRRTS
jgi:hypothetical protein